MRNNEVGDIWVLKKYDPPFNVGDKFIIVFTIQDGRNIFLRHVKTNMDYGWINTGSAYIYDKFEPFSLTGDEEML
jgi:hypothetical protein